MVLVRESPRRIRAVDGYESCNWKPQNPGRIQVLSLFKGYADGYGSGYISNYHCNGERGKSGWIPEAQVKLTSEKEKGVPV